MLTLWVGCLAVAAGPVLATEADAVRWTEDASGAVVLSNSGIVPDALPASGVQPLTGIVPFRRLVLDAAHRHGVAPALLAAVMQAESAGQPQAVSQKGARGLMQLMPGLARAYGVSDVFDPAQSLQAGARHLRWLLDQFGNDLVLTAAAYNAGTGAVQRHGHQVPPFAETQAYVRRVLALHEALKGLDGAAGP